MREDEEEERGPGAHRRHEEGRASVSASDLEDQPLGAQPGRHDRECERQGAPRAEREGGRRPGPEKERDQPCAPPDPGEDSREESPQGQKEASVHVDILEVRLPPRLPRGDPEQDEERTGGKRLDAEARRIAVSERRARETHRDPPPGGKGGEREGEEHLRIEAVGEGAVEESDGEKVERPVRSQEACLRLEPREIRGDEEGAEEKDVVVGRMRGRRTPPGEARGSPPGPRETGARRGTEHDCDRRGADPIAVLLHEEPDPRREEEDAKIESRADFDTHRHELAAGDPGKNPPLRRRQDALLPEAIDGRGDIGIHAASIRPLAGRSPACQPLPVALRILVTGAGGQLGQVLVRELRRGGHEVAALTRAALDLTDRAQVQERVGKLRAQAVVNTAVFGVEESEDDPKAALAVNAFAVRALAEACRASEATFVHFSSDFVFDGATSSPYRETDRPNPLSVYGATKLLGEIYAQGVPRHFVLRVESLFGIREGKSTIDRMCMEVRAGKTVSAFYDRTVSPAFVDDVAAATRRLLEGKAAPGVYHCVNAGFTTWHELAVELVRQLGSASNVVPVSADGLASKVVRPKFAALSNEKLANLGIELPGWQSALGRAILAPPPSATPIPASGIRLGARS